MRGPLNRGHLKIPMKKGHAINWLAARKTTSMGAPAHASAAHD